jgi:pimeloyl-ACP methyl ester carboxylesterase
MRPWFCFDNRLRAFALLAALVLVAGCVGIPVGVTRADPQTVRRNLTANALSADRPSLDTENVLDRLNLTETFDSDPVQALGKLREAALASGENDLYFALAELSFLHAEQSGDRSWNLAAALYAWSYLFAGAPPDPFDPRWRTAADLYNLSVTNGFAAADGTVDLRAGTFPLPFGELAVEFDESSLEWNGRRLRHFIPVAELEVHGLSSRFRTPGIGAPLAADASVDNPDEAQGFLAPRLKIPATAVLIVDDPRKQIAGGNVRARLELYSDPDPETLLIAGQHVPLEREPTATLAAMLADSPIWKRELQAFFGKLAMTEDGRLVALRPHKRGRIPVVFVHGTNSSPGRWAEMVNVLDNDPRIHRRFEPWFFFYNSGNPILYSSYLLRKNLSGAVAELDPSGDDACLRDMVVIGHSQGGLLTKMTVVDSGDRFWRKISNRPFDEVKMDETQREVARQTFFVKPLPFVRRVVFIATPHHGSYLADHFLGRIARRLVTLPATLTKTSLQLLRFHPRDALDEATSPPTSIDNMQGSNPFLKTLAALPVAQGVHAHSIVAVRGDGPPELGDDGVVKYASAHIEGVDSELIVHSGHSTQGEPATVEGVRRILLLHLTEP